MANTTTNEGGATAGERAHEAGCYRGYPILSGETEPGAGYVNCPAYPEVRRDGTVDPGCTCWCHGPDARTTKGWVRRETVGQALDRRMAEVRSDWPDQAGFAEQQEGHSIVEAALEVADGDPDLAMDAISDATTLTPEAAGMALETLAQPHLREGRTDMDVYRTMGLGR